MADGPLWLMPLADGPLWLMHESELGLVWEVVLDGVGETDSGIIRGEITLVSGH